MPDATRDASPAARIAIVGAGPSGLVTAIALARRGVRTTVFERDQHPEVAPRFNPDRSYTIDISGHGLKAIRHLDAAAAFDDRMIAFKGLKLPDGRTDEWTLPGWTGSRGDILRSLMSVAHQGYQDRIDLQFNRRVESVDVDTGLVTFHAESHLNPQQFDFIIGADGAGSVVRRPWYGRFRGSPSRQARIRTTAP
jgi:kynurenine 3-monooxygenase